MCLVGSFVVNNILKRLHVEIVKEAMEYKLERLNTTLIRSIYKTPIYKQVDVLPGTRLTTNLRATSKEIT